MGIHPDVLAMVEENDLDGDMALVAQECGLDTAVSLYKGMAGTSVSVPKSALMRTFRRYIRKRYTGYNALELAVRCGISERQVYVIVGGATVKNDQCRMA